MTDQTIPADVTPEDMEHARAYVQDFLDATYAPDRTLAVARVLQALLPTPPRPTLEGMTADELAACQWMQADVKTWGRAVIVLPNERGGRAVTLNRRGHMAYEDHADVTPRPDLPRMAFPGDTPDAAPESTLAVGSVWDDADALARACEETGRDQIIALDADGYAYTWSWYAEWWEGSAPPLAAPYTIIHTGREADE